MYPKKEKTLLYWCKTRFSVEPEGVEPSSGEGKSRTFYMLSWSLDFRIISGSQQPNTTLFAWVSHWYRNSTAASFYLWHRKSNPQKQSAGTMMAGEYYTRPYALPYLVRIKQP